MANANTKTLTTTHQDPLHNLAETDWYVQFIEESDLYLCDQSTLNSAIAEAPNAAAAGYVYGIRESRVRAQILNG